MGGGAGDSGGGLGILEKFNKINELDKAYLIANFLIECCERL